MLNSPDWQFIIGAIDVVPFHRFLFIPTFALPVEKLCTLNKNQGLRSIPFSEIVLELLYKQIVTVVWKHWQLSNETFYLILVKPLSDTFSFLLYFLGYFYSAIIGTTFLPTFFYFSGQISYPSDFINWRNRLVEFYGNNRPVDVIFCQTHSQSSRYFISVISRQTHLLQV